MSDRGMTRRDTQLARMEQNEAARIKSIIAELTHPIYLDTPMLVSFLATVDDGVSFSSEVAEKVADTRKASGEGSGEAKLPGLPACWGSVSPPQVSTLERMLRISRLRASSFDNTPRRPYSIGFG